MQCLDFTGIFSAVAIPGGQADTCGKSMACAGKLEKLPTIGINRLQVKFQLFATPKRKNPAQFEATRGGVHKPPAGRHGSRLMAQLENEIWTSGKR